MGWIEALTKIAEQIEKFFSKADVDKLMQCGRVLKKADMVFVPDAEKTGDKRVEGKAQSKSPQQLGPK